MLCHSLALTALDCASKWSGVYVERYLCHSVKVLPSQDALIDFVKHDAFDFLKECFVLDDTIQGERIVNGFGFEANRIGFSVFVEDVQLHGFEVVVRVNVDFRPEVKVVSVEGEGLVYFFHIFKIAEMR